MNGTELFEAALGLILGVCAWVKAYRAIQTGETFKSDDDDAPRILNSRKEPGEFAEQVTLLLMGGLLGLGFVVWTVFRAYSH